MDNDKDIYLDKIRLGAVIVNKELEFINYYNNLIRNVRGGIIEEKYINEDELFGMCFQNLVELYDFLKDDYLEKLPKQDIEKINLAVEKWENLEPLGFDDLRESKRIMLSVMAKAGFHDIFRKFEGDEFGEF